MGHHNHKRGRPEPLIIRLATELIQTLGLQHDASPELGTIQAMDEEARHMVHGLEPRNLGVVICQAPYGRDRTSIYRVYGSTWLPRRDLRGKDILRVTAALAVVAQAIDMLRDMRIAWLRLHPPEPAPPKQTVRRRALAPGPDQRLLEAARHFGPRTRDTLEQDYGNCRLYLDGNPPSGSDIE